MLNRTRWPLAAAALLILGIPFAGTAFATEATGPHWVFEDVKFRSHSATGFASQPGAFSDLGNLDAFDSTYASGIAKFDTTASVSTQGWALPNSAASLDSSTVARLFIYDSGLASVTLGKTSATAESIYIKTQVSPNGKTWFDCAVIPGQSPVLNAFTVQTTLNAAVITFTASQNTGISDKMWSLRYVRSPGAAARKDAIDVNSLVEFPAVRWIIMGSRSVNHAYSASVGHWTTSSGQQPQ